MFTGAVVFILISMILINLGVSENFEITCHHYDAVEVTNTTRGIVFNEGRSIRCKKANEFMICFAVWIKNGSTTSVIKQSCMLMNHGLCRQRSCLRSQFNRHTGMHFCCCFGKLCNTDLHKARPQLSATRSIWQKSNITAVEAQETESETFSAIFAAGIASVSILAAGGIFLAVAMLLKRRGPIEGRYLCFRKLSGIVRLPNMKHRGISASRDSCQTASTRLLSSRSRQKLIQSESPCEVSNFCLKELLHSGEFGEVWKAILPSGLEGEEGDGTFCVKTFAQGSQRQYYHAERDIYSLAMISGHPNIVTCHGWGIRHSDDLAMIVFEFCSHGSLQNFLIHQALSWSQFRLISMCAVAGVAHLHSEVGVPGINAEGIQEASWFFGERKFPIAHRDINSRNMLVRSNGTLAICDMGFAVKFGLGGSSYYKNNVCELAQNNPPQEVGTKRYLAPEVLEGCVDLRECETSLKQADVYALALVLWEVASRCSVFYPSGKVPPYMTPYARETGPQPDVATMTEVVVTRKCRPVIPTNCYLDESVGHVLVSTLTESWDADPEARISALCILERLKALPLSLST